MCTASWLLTATGYQLFFNRDEQKKRIKALPPYLSQNQTVCYPLDPQGGGTWIGLNSSGVSLCLLNNYQAQAAQFQSAGLLTSRGVIIPTLFAQVAQTAQIESASMLSLLKTLVESANFAPFSLLYFPNALTKQAGTVYQYNWNGERLSVHKAISPVISSGVDFERVQESRKAIYLQFMTQTRYSAEKRHLFFHACHLPQKNERSVCMHRADAQTVSFSHIRVNDSEKNLAYYDKPLCEKTTPVVTQLLS